MRDALELATDVDRLSARSSWSLLDSSRALDIRSELDLWILFMFGTVIEENNNCPSRSEDQCSISVVAGRETLQKRGQW